MIGFRCGILIVLAAVSLRAQQPVYPGEYLPVHPGSWWTYVTETGDTVRDSTQSEYALEANGVARTVFDENLSGLDFAPIHSMSHLSYPWPGMEGSLHKVAPGAGMNVTIYGYQIYFPTLQGRNPTPIRVLSPDKGDYWHWSSDIRPYGCKDPDPPATPENVGCTVRAVVHTDTVVTLNGKTYDSVLVVEYWGSPFGREMYRKGIGILSMTLSKGPPEDYVVHASKTLLDYRINTAPKKIPQVYHVMTPRTDTRLATRGSPDDGSILDLLRRPEDEPIRYAWCHETVCNWTTGMTEDTLVVAMRMNSGLPPQVEVSEGRLDTLPAKRDSSWWHFRFRILDKDGQYVRLRLSQAGDSAWHPATPFESFLCLPRIPTFRKETDGSGRTLLISDYTYNNQWMKWEPAWPGASPTWRQIPGATGKEFVPEDTGFFKLASLYDPSASQSESLRKCAMTPGLSLDSVEIRDLNPNAIAAARPKGTWIRIQGRRIRLDLPRADGSNPTVRLHTLEGRSLQGVRVDSHAEGAEVTFASSPKPGLYLVRACAGGGCRTFPIALP